jgi:regulatory protein
MGSGTISLQSFDSEELFIARQFGLPSSSNPHCSAAVRSKVFCYASFVPFNRPKRLYEDENALYDYAVRSLGRRMRTVAELKRLMRQRVPKDERGNLLVEMVILRLKEQKYLNDTNYAAAYSTFRRDNEKFGRRRVITDLKVKGVHQDVIEKVVDEAYAAVNEEELARAYLKRKRLKKPTNDKEAARIFRGLMRAGFGVGVAIKVLKNWQVDDELLTALQEETE